MPSDPLDELIAQGEKLLGNATQPPWCNCDPEEMYRGAIHQHLKTKTAVIACDYESHNCMSNDDAEIACFAVNHLTQFLALLKAGQKMAEEIETLHEIRTNYAFDSEAMWESINSLENKLAAYTTALAALNQEKPDAK